jgi:predicted AlkP superfamily phosphohydrolase/phosphomutase
MDGDKPIDFQAKRNSKLEKQKKQGLSNDIVICYIQGTDPDGEKVFSYVAIEADLLEEFNEAIHAGNVDVDDFGYRIVSGFGEPSEAVRQMMTDDYGFDHEQSHLPIPPKPSNDD